MSTCEATYSEPGGDPETFTCGEDWDHDPPHIDPDDGTEWQVTVGGIQ